jgi:5-methylcytosine-specific restriction endonuclease McrA
MSGGYSSHTVEYERHLNSPRWRQLRSVVLQRDGYACAACGWGDVHAMGKGLDVHHTTYQRLGCERLDDLISLCVECHHSEHESIGASALYNAQVSGYAAKKYGEDAYNWPDDVDDEFDDWLERKEDGHW